MCTMWYIQDGIKFARHWLEQLEIPATERIKLAKQYEIRDWVAPAVKELLKSPLNNLSNDDLNHINVRIYCIIAKAKEAMERQRKIIAAYPPSLPKDSHDFQTAWCASHVACGKVGMRFPTWKFFYQWCLIIVSVWFWKYKRTCGNLPYSYGISTWRWCPPLSLLLHHASHLFSRLHVDNSGPKHTIPFTSL